MSPEVNSTAVESPSASPAAKKHPAKKAAKKSAKKSTKKVSKASTNGHREGKVVGYEAKKAEDVAWSENKVAFYKALKRCGGSGTSEKIAKASNGKINAGHARHFGYHGIGGGLIRLGSNEDVRGFVFELTAKGRNIYPDAELKKQQEAKEKTKAKAAK